MIVKVITYIIGGVLAAGFLWYAGKVVVVGISAVNSSHQTTKRGPFSFDIDQPGE